MSNGIKRYTTKPLVDDDGCTTTGLRECPEGELVFFEDVSKLIKVEVTSISFNPHPKRQAEEMVKQFDKPLATVAARMCNEISVIITPVPSVAPWTCSAYWQAVISHINKK